MATPKLRFKEFNYEYNFQELQDFCTITSEKYNPINTKNLPCIELEHLATNNGGLLGYTNSNEQKSIKSKFKIGDVLYGKLRPYLRKTWFAEFNGVCTSEIWVMTSKIMFHKYLYYLVQTNTFNGITNVSSGSKMPRADWNFIKGYSFGIPTKNEQKKIADFLSLLDRKIALQEKKIALLKDYKKGLLENTIQEKNIGIWNTLKLSDVLIERKEYSIKGGDYIHCSLTQKGVVDKTERYERDFLVRDEEKNYKITKLNDICYNPANLKFGVICRNTYGEAIFSPIYVTFEVKKKYSPTYIGYYLSRWNFINAVRKYEEGTVYERMAVKPTDLLNFEVSLPNLETQLKIADVLKKTESKEILNVVKLNRIKNLKQALLQQMFV